MADSIRVYLTVIGLIYLSECLMAKEMAGDPKEFLRPVTFASLSGWQSSDKTAAFQAFVSSCQQMSQDDRAFAKKPLFGGVYQDWQTVCDAALNISVNGPNNDIQGFFEQKFVPLQVMDKKKPNGLFTGYFEPEVQGSLVKSEQYSIPVYAKPKSLVRFNEQQEKQSGLRYGRLVDGKPVTYFTRKEIEEGALASAKLEILWLKSPVDAFFMQIQGSGRVELPDGSFVRIAYAAKTGLPYTAVGGELVKSGDLEKEKVSMQTIRNWMEKNPKDAVKLRLKNKSFVFFRLLDQFRPQSGPVGAQGIGLSPKASIAIDRRFWPFGMPLWLDTKIKFSQEEKAKKWRALLISQDTGSAIRGMARGDVFWGAGRKAAWIAGHMKAAGVMTILLPKALAKDLLNK